MEDQPNVTRRKPSRFRPLHSFSLRTLLIFIAVVAIPCAWLGRKIEQKRSERELTDFIHKSGGQISYPYEGIKNGKPPGPEWLKKLLGTNFFCDVDDVDLRKDKAADDALLKKIAAFTRLKSLWLDGTQVTDAGVANLSDLNELDRVSLTATEITDAALDVVKGWSRLEVLHLDKTRVTDAGIAKLAGLSNLTYLNLNLTAVGDSGLSSLNGLTRLEWLRLKGTDVTDAGLIKLKQLANLGTLELEGTKVTSAGVADLHKALPNCEITY
jgi:hypothetical protein